MRTFAQKYITVLLGVLLLAGCATTKLAPVTGNNATLEDDEKRLWNRVEEEEDALNHSGSLYEDKQLLSYLNAVARKLQPPGVLKSIPFEVRVLKNPYLGAFCYANGAVYIHTGLLARMENEAQLATLLGHEMTHATHRHMLKQFRDTKNKRAVLATVHVTLGAVPGVDLLGTLGTAAAVTGYSRDLEREADKVGLRLMVQAGYDPREAPKLFEFLLKELEENDIEEPYFFGTHPRLKERIDTYEELLAATYAGHTGGVANKKAFIARTWRLVYDNAVLDLRAGRFDSAERGVRKYLSIKPRSARAHVLLGEIIRQRGGDGAQKEAEKQYRKALSLNPSHAEAHKALGLLYLKEGRKGPAKKSLKKYLSLAKNPPDKAYIREYIRQCK
jgi:predicted Zn-dependent protease